MGSVRPINLQIYAFSTNWQKFPRMTAYFLPFFDNIKIMSTFANVRFFQAKQLLLNSP